MLRSLRLVLPSAVLALAPAAAQSAPNPAEVDRIFSRYNRTDAPGCALGVFQNEAIVYRRGYGMADLNQGIAIDPSTVFYVASTSKQFTALSIALLAEQGKIRLDDPVRKWVPELPAYADRITIDHLVHHTSGIRDYLGLWQLSGRSAADEITDEAGLDLIARQRAADFEPGAQWSYSNSGYFLLSVIVKRASGLSLRQFAEQNVFRPLGMGQTHFHDDNTMIVPHRAEGYQPDGKGGFQIVRTSFAAVGDGGLLTTVEDLFKYDANFYHNRLGGLGAQLIEQVTTPGRLANGDPLTYAFGLMIGTHRGLKVVEHGGSFIGFRAQLVRFPTEKFSVAVLCNDYTAAPERLAYQVADLYLAPKLAAEESRKPGGAAVTPPAAVLERAAGRYEVMPGMVAEVTRDGDGLRLKVGPSPAAPLRAVADTVFESDGFPGTITFARAADGSTGLIASVFGSKIPAPKLPPTPMLTAADRAAVVGRYVSDELDTWAVVAADGEGLKARVRFGPWLPLTPLAKDRFGAGAAAVTLDRDKAGRVTGYRLSAARSHNIRFEKVAAPAG
jgi:CubicO group peptidase (beta-lactamase class C family)